MSEERQLSTDETSSKEATQSSSETQPPRRQRVNVDRSPSFDMTNIVEIIVISILTTGGAFVACAWLVGAIGPESVFNLNAIQLAMGGIGGALLGVGAIGRWLVSNYG